MKKRGFTLIELLAVIVVLAIIALITMPVITGVVEKTRKGAAKNSAYGILDAVNLYYATHDETSELEFVCDGKKCATEDGKKLIFKGQIPTSGSIIAKVNGNHELDTLKIGKYCVSGTRKNLIIEKNCAMLDKTKPTCELQVTEDGVSFASKTPSNVEYGMNTTGTPEYNGIDSLELSTGTFYGYVKAENRLVGSCSVTITNTTVTSWTKKTKTCSLVEKPKTYGWVYKETTYDPGASGGMNLNFCTGSTSNTCTAEYSASGGGFLESQRCYAESTQIGTNASCKAKCTGYICFCGIYKNKVWTCQPTSYYPATYEWGTESTVAAQTECTPVSVTCDEASYTEAKTKAEEDGTLFLGLPNVECIPESATCPSETTKLNDTYCYTIN